MAGLAKFGDLFGRLKENVAEREFESPFEPRARAVYLMIATELSIGVGLLGVLGFSVDPSLWQAFAIWPLVAVGGMMLRRLGHGRTGGAMEATGLVVFQGVASLTVFIPLAALSGPFADGALSAADRMLGFDWLSYFHATIAWRLPLSVGYSSFLWQELVVIAALFATGRGDRCWQFVTAATIALGITMAIFPFVPAEGAFVHYGLPRATFEPLVGAVPWDYLDDLKRLKAGYRVFDWSVANGYVSFPSYHTAVAVLFIWAIWPLRWLRIPVVVLNVP